MKFLTISLALGIFCSVFLLNGAEFIINADFRHNANGKAGGWGVRGNIEFKTEDADVILKPGETQAMLSQYGLKPPVLVPMELTWEAEGIGGTAKYRIYIERARVANGVASGHSAHGTAVWREAGSGWKEESASFVVPAQYDVCYIIMQLDAKSPAAVKIRKLSLHENPNAPRFLGGYWSVPTPHELQGNDLKMSGNAGLAILSSIPVQPGKKYALTFTARGFGKSSATTGYHTFKTSIMPDVKGSFFSDDTLTDTDQKKSHIFEVPADAKFDKVAVQFQLRDKGGVVFSDIAFTEIEKNPTDSWELSLQSPSYRGLIFSGASTEIKGSVHADKSAVNLTAELRSGEAVVANAKSVFRDGTATFTLNPNELLLGKYSLVTSIYGQDGNVLKTFAEPVQVLNPTDNMVTILPNGYPAVNGKPFFPVMHRQFDEPSLYYASRQGLSLVNIHTWSKTGELLAELNKLHALGLKAFIVMNAPRAMSQVEAFKETMRNTMTPEILAHPALFGWVHIDEPLWAGVPHAPMRAVYEFMKEFDPYHPVWMNTAPRNSIEDLKPYAACCDILGVDVYPVPYPSSHSGIEDKGMTSVGKYTLRMKELGGKGKSIFLWLQGFRWPECIRREDSAQRYPTPDEFRFMVFDTLLNGGNGFAIWGVQYHGPFTKIDKADFFMNAMYPAIKDAYELSGLFTQGRQLPDIETPNPAVRCAVMQYQDRKFYFLLNCSEKPQTVSIPNIGSANLAPFGVNVIKNGDLPEPANPLPPENAEYEKDQKPFHTYFNNIINGGYRGNANWIWDADSIAAAGSCWIARSFQAAKDGEKTTLAVAADDSSIVYFNGVEIGRSGFWTDMFLYDVTKLVKKGPNTVIIYAADGGGLPCGVLAEIKCGSEVIISDSSWKTLPGAKTGMNRPSVEAFVQGKAASIIAPYGKGEWGKGAIVKPVK